MDELTQLKLRVAEMERFIKLLTNSTTIPYEVDQAFRIRLADLIKVPAGLANAPLPLITAPTGGATIDTQARTALNTIITRLEDVEIVLPN